MFPNHWTLTELHQLCWRCLRQPGPCLRSGTSKWTSSCTVSWSMKLQHFSCFAGAAACTPGCRRDGKAAHPSVKGCKPCRHWGRSWGKDRLGRKPGGGDLLDMSLFSYPSRYILTTVLKPSVQLGAGALQPAVPKAELTWRSQLCRVSPSAEQPEGKSQSPDPTGLLVNPGSCSSLLREASKQHGNFYCLI